MKKLNSLYSHGGLFLLLLPILALGLYSFQKHSIATIDLSDPVCVESVEYDLNTIQFMSLLDENDKENLTELEKLDFKLRRMERHFRKCLFDDGQLSTEIEILNPEEVYSKWMDNKPTKIVLNRDNLYMETADGEEVLRKTRNPKSVLLHDNKASLAALHGLGTPGTFSELTNKTIAEKEIEGFVFQADAGGVVSGALAEKNILIDPTAMSIEEQVFENNELTHKVKTQYRMEGTLVPERTITELYKTLTWSGVCVKETIVEEYENYTRNVPDQAYLKPTNGFGANSNLIGNQMNKFKLSPNPAVGELKLSMAEAEIDSITDVDVVSVGGAKAQGVTYRHAGTSLDVNVSSLHPGLYFLKIRANGEIHNFRFVKH